MPSVRASVLALVNVIKSIKYFHSLLDSYHVIKYRICALFSCFAIIIEEDLDQDICQRTFQHAHNTPLTPFQGKLHGAMSTHPFET